MPQTTPFISQSVNKLYSNSFSNKAIANELLNTFLLIFPNCCINIYFINNTSKKIESSVSNSDLWPIPSSKIRWFTTKKHLSINSKKALYVPSRPKFILTDFKQLLLDQKKYNHTCNDGLFLLLENENKESFGLIFIHSWHIKQSLPTVFKDLESKIKLSMTYLSNAMLALENHSIHKKVKNLLSDKTKLTARLHKDEKNLKKRVLELSTLYETSTEFSHSLNYSEIIHKAIQSLEKVLSFNYCCIYIHNLFNRNEFFISTTATIPKKLLKNLNEETIKEIEFYTEDSISLSSSKTHFFHLDKYPSLKTTARIQSNTHLPILFENKIIGVITLSSTIKNLYQKNELKFFHTLSNHLAATLGHLKIIQGLEKSKLYSVLESMSDPAILIDETNNLHIVNTEAKKILGSQAKKNISQKELISLLKTSGLYSLYEQVSKTKKPIKNQLIQHNNNFFSITTSPLLAKELGYLGIIFMFKDITEIKEMERIQTQRLTAISKTNLIIKSIKNLDELLNVLIDYLLSISNCNMGSIQLNKNNSFITGAHINFPEKVRRTYRFNSGDSIADHVQKTKERLIIDNFFNNQDLNPNVKILIDTYICIPIIYNNTLIGIINLVRKFGTNTTLITSDDIETLSTITELAATAIQNARLYEENLEREKIKQELKVATAIQKNLLPTSIPKQKKLMISTLNIPAREIGGDYYDFIDISPTKLGVIIADIVGKGIPAGLYMAMLKSILTRNIPPNLSPKETLFNLNNIIYHDPVINKFIPLFYGIFDLKAHSFTYSNAGHEPPLILKNTTFTKLDTKGFPLGGYENELFEENSVTLENDDLLALFTDGIIEIRNKTQTQLGVKGLQNILLPSKKFPTNIIINKLKSHLIEYSENLSNNDDITAILCKFNKQFKKTDSILSSTSITVSSEIKHIKKVRKKALEFCKKAQFNQKSQLDIQLAINEAHANIIEHAYLGDETKKIIFNFSLFTDKIIITIQDNGLPFNKSSLSKKELDINEIEGSGLGLYLINTLMDEIDYTTEKNKTTLTLTKYKL